MFKSKVDIILIIILIITIIAFAAYYFYDTYTSQCVGEGGTIGSVMNHPKCCFGLKEIRIKETKDGNVGWAGICTRKCGNGKCDSKTESHYNCPEDCK